MCLVGAPSYVFKGTALCRSLYNYRVFEIIGGKYVICPPLKSFLIINSLEICLGSEAWCSVSLQKSIFIHFHAFKYIQSLLNHC